MPSVVAVHVKWPVEFANCFGQLDRALLGHAVITMRKVNVSQAIPGRGLDSRDRAIDTDHRPYSQRLELGKACLTVGLAPADDHAIHSNSVGQMLGGEFNRLSLRRDR